MSSINHEERCISGVFSKSRKNVFKDTHVIPSDKPIIKGPIRSIFFWSILPLKAGFEGIDDSTDDFLVITLGDASGARKEWANVSIGAG